MKKVIRYLDHTGDTRVEFDTEDKVATDEARKLFERLTKSGQPAFAVNRANGQEDKKLKSFDELENDTIVIPRIAGG